MLPLSDGVPNFLSLRHVGLSTSRAITGFKVKFDSFCKLSMDSDGCCVGPR